MHTAVGRGPLVLYRPLVQYKWKIYTYTVVAGGGGGGDL